MNEFEQCIAEWAVRYGESQDENKALRARVVELEARLEIDHHFDMDGNRIEIPPHERDKQWDGIACRDETIKLQDRAVDELRQQLAAVTQEAARLREALRKCLIEMNAMNQQLTKGHKYNEGNSVREARALADSLLEHSTPAPGGTRHE